MMDVKISTFGVRKLKRQVKVDTLWKCFQLQVLPAVMVLYVKFSIFGVKMGGQCSRSLWYTICGSGEKVALSKFAILKLKLKEYETDP